MGALLLACLTFGGCEVGGNRVRADTGEAVELRTYQVPPDHQEGLRRMLATALGSGDTRTGRVSTGPGGALVVVAPPGVQAGIQQLLDAGFEAPPAAQPVRLTYWFVIGRALDAAPATRPYSVTGGRNIPLLERVLAEIAAAQGPTEFHLFEQIQLTSMYQDLAQTTSPVSIVRQTVSKTGEQVVADVQIRLQGTPPMRENQLNSRVVLKEGQFIVVGQTGFAGRSQEMFPDAAEEDVLTLYYVMSADLDP
jgi:hypothetical protein